MGTVAARVGTSRILVETSDVSVPADLAESSHFGTEKTGVADDARDAYGQLKDLLRHLADDLGGDLATAKPNWPSEVVLRFGLSFSTSGNVWVLKASGEMSCSVTMTWSKDGAGE